MHAHATVPAFLYRLSVFFGLSRGQALLEVVDSGAKNMEIAIVRFQKPIEVTVGSSQFAKPPPPRTGMLFPQLPSG